MLFGKDVGFTHQAQLAVVEVLVAKIDERGAGAEVFVEKGEGFGAESLVDAAVDERNLLVVELLECFLIELVFLGEEVKFAGGEEGQVTELFRVARHEGSFGAIESGEGGREVALSGFIDDGEVEKLGFKREDAVEIVGGGDPDREDLEEGGGVEAAEGLFLSRGVDRFQGVAVGGEGLEGASTVHGFLKVFEMLTTIVSPGFEKATLVKVVQKTEGFCEEGFVPE